MSGIKLVVSWVKSLHFKLGGVEKIIASLCVRDVIFCVYPVYKYTLCLYLRLGVSTEYAVVYVLCCEFLEKPDFTPCYCFV